MNLVSVSDTCTRLGISRSTLYELIAKGDIAVLKIGSRTLIGEDELARFIAAAAEAGKRRVAASAEG
mgnify:CR=1 FL=1